MINPAVMYIIDVMKAMVNKTIPLRSNVSPFGSSATSFSLSCAHIVTTIPIGTLIKKFRRQLIIVRNPPSIGPTTKAAAITMLRMPIAFPISFRLKASATIMVPLDTSIDPPTACTTLKAISWLILAAMPQSNEPIVNTASP